MQVSLLSEITSNEIIKTLKGMPHNKSFRPDGYTVKIFLATWDVVWPRFVAAVKEFFSSGRLLKQLNTTALALVPKVPQSSLVIDFRHIACCNVVYKYISKFLANRLKVHLPHLLSSNHSAFIEGRRIMDNILLA